MSSGKKKMAKKIEHIRIYNSNHLSFKVLKSKKVFSDIYKLSSSIYKLAIYELIIHTVKNFNAHDTFNRDEFKEFIEDIADMVEVNHDVIFPNSILSTISSDLFSIYQDNVFFEFRGEVVEYLMVYLEKDSTNKIFHEPRFYHKRKKLINDAVWGKGCLVDVVKQNSKTRDITLIECKANLDNTIKQLSNPRSSFEKKLNYLETLYNKLGTYKNPENDYIKVEKSLATVNQAVLKLPSRYSNYNYINLLDHFIFKLAN